MDGARVVQAQTMQLLARHVGARIHEERGLPAAFQREIAELEHLAFNHELDELLLVLLHEGPFLLFHRAAARPLRTMILESADSRNVGAKCNP